MKMRFFFIVVGIPFQACASQEAADTFHVTYGLSARKGMHRVNMEDFHQEPRRISNGTLFWGIYDGHGGVSAAQEVVRKIPYVLPAYLQTNDPCAAITKTFKFIDASLLANHYLSGTTALVGLLKEKMLYLAWIGDTRALVIRDGQLIYETTDHKPGHEREKKRIERAGACVYNSSNNDPPIWRVNGLSLSRALGDRKEKLQKRGAVIAEPDLHAICVCDQDFVVMACDGVFDVLSSQEVTDLVSKYQAIPNRQAGKLINFLAAHDDRWPVTQKGEEKLRNLASIIRDTAARAGSTDNMSVLVVKIAAPSSE